MRAQDARRTLEENRAELRATVAAARSGTGSQFPRSATFRWLLGHLRPTALASTAVTALVFRRPLLRRLLGGVLRHFA
jgi:hypothetical protein